MKYEKHGSTFIVAQCRIDWVEWKNLAKSKPIGVASKREGLLAFSPISTQNLQSIFTLTYLVPFVVVKSSYMWIKIVKQSRPHNQLLAHRYN